MYTYREHKLYTLLVSFVLGILVCVGAIAESNKKPADKSHPPVYKPPKLGAPITRIGE